MANLLLGNAPCSWGTLEFAGGEQQRIGFEQMLDELVETGYTGTELGDWGYMPTDPSRLRHELDKRGLVMLGAFVPVALKYPSALEEGLERALRTARLLAQVASRPAPYLVLADNNGAEPERTRQAGRIRTELALSASEWKTFAAAAEQIARAVRDQTGLKTVFHHHCAGYVETPEEIDTLLDLTDPALLGLVFDTGHYSYGSRGASVVEALDRYRERLWYVHLKDCHPEIAARARAQGWDYFEALRQGVFCELGRGGVDFPNLLRRLAALGYSGYMVVEQDILPGMGSPKDSARRNRQFLASIAHCFEAAPGPSVPPCEPSHSGDQCP